MMNGIAFVFTTLDLTSNGGKAEERNRILGMWISTLNQSKVNSAWLDWL